MFYFIVAVWIVFCLVRALRSSDLYKSAPCLAAAFTLIAVITYIQGTLQAALVVFGTGLLLASILLISGYFKRNQPG